MCGRTARTVRRAGTGNGTLRRHRASPRPNHASWRGNHGTTWTALSKVRGKHGPACRVTRRVVWAICRVARMNLTSESTASLSRVGVVILVSVVSSSCHIRAYQHLAGKATPGEPARVGVNLTCVAVEECVEDRLARDAIRAQPVQVRARKPCRGNKFRSRVQRITVTVQPIEQGLLQRIGSGTLISGIRSGRSTDADGLTFVVQLHLLSRFDRRHRGECATVGYSTVTDLARLRGLSMS